MIPISSEGEFTEGSGLKEKITNVINADDQYEADLKAAGLALNGKPIAVARLKAVRDELENLDPDADPAAYRRARVQYSQHKCKGADLQLPRIL